MTMTTPSSPLSTCPLEAEPPPAEPARDPDVGPGDRLTLYFWLAGFALLWGSVLFNVLTGMHRH
jgi:hypothetical protein